MAERIRLDLDWDSLFPGSDLTIAGVTIEIKPLSLFQLAKTTRTLKGFGKILSENNISWENYQQQENIITIASILLDQFPEVLSEASNIHVEDIQRLPLESIVLILDKVLEVNLESRESLEKNFRSLAAKFETATKNPAKKLKSVKRSKS
jgi:hypothetical protein